ncbi:MAG: hypothetical protein ABGX16_13100 [Pirellulales bacterium]
MSDDVSAQGDLQRHTFTYLDEVIGFPGLGLRAGGLPGRTCSQLVPLLFPGPC